MIDIIGKKFNKITVIEKTKEKKYSSYLYKCSCECGEIIYEISSKIKSGERKSCSSCKSENRYFKILYKDSHMRSNSRLYKIMAGMKERCNNPNNKNYDKYGGRGITISKEWLDDFMNFYSWAISNGYRENLTIDRINNNGNYEPSNCRWVDMKVQANNRRNTKYIEYEGIVYSYSEIEKKFNITQSYLSKNLIKGYSIYEIILMNNCFMKSDYIKLSNITLKEFNNRIDNKTLIPTFINKSGKRMFSLL